MQNPGPLKNVNVDITWTDDPNEAVIKHTLAKKGYDIKSLREKEHESRYTMQQSRWVRLVLADGHDFNFFYQ
jgi:hypothetical protein